MQAVHILAFIVMSTFTDSTHQILIMFRAVPEKKIYWAVISVPAKQTHHLFQGNKKIINLQSHRVALFTLDCLMSRSFNRSGTGKVKGKSTSTTTVSCLIIVKCHVLLLYLQ